jgi:hypothetical protein
VSKCQKQLKENLSHAMNIRVTQIPRQAFPFKKYDIYVPLIVEVYIFGVLLIIWVSFDSLE